MLLLQVRWEPRWWPAPRRCRGAAWTAATAAPAVVHRVAPTGRRSGRPAVVGLVSSRPGVAGATGRGVIAGVWVCAAITMAASAFNGALTFRALGSPWAVGLTIGIAVDVALCVALIGDRALHLTGTSTAWGRALRWTTAGMSLALNCGASIVSGHYWAAVFHAFLPLLLVVLTEAAQSYTLAYSHIADERQQASERAVVERDRADRELVASLASVLAIGTRLASRPAPARQVVTPAPRQPVKQAPDLAELVERARPLMPLGRGSLARELGCTEDKARKIIAALDRERQRPVALLREA